MLHTKFHGYRSIGSGDEDFFKVFTIYGHGRHVGHVTQLIYIIINNFHFFPYKSLCHQIGPWRKRGQGQPRVII